MKLNTHRLRRLNEKNRNKKSVSITLDDRNLALAKKLAEEKGLTLSSLIDVALEDFLYSVLEDSDQTEIDKLELEYLDEWLNHLKAKMDFKKEEKRE